MNTMMRMTKSTYRSTKKPWFLPGALSAVAIIASLPAVAVTASPSAIEFETIDAATTIQLTKDGKAIPASAIGSVSFMAGGHNYAHMIEVDKATGALMVRPSEKIEIGSYDLVVETSEGSATVSVMAPLDKLHTSLESRAERLGMSVEQLKGLLGESQRIGTEYIDLNIPAVYYVGQTIEIPVEVVEGRTYVWSVNGHPVEIGGVGGALHYTFTKPGIYDFTYVEMKGEREMARGFGATSVVSEPALHLIVDEETPQKFEAPKGYEHYTWEIDGVTMGDQDTLVYDFERKGSHVVNVTARTPLPGTTEALREITFVVTVT